jgi:hypothetical protein
MHAFWPWVTYLISEVDNHQPLPAHQQVSSGSGPRRSDRSARFVCPAAFIPCAGARDEETASKLLEAFRRWIRPPSVCSSFARGFGDQNFVLWSRVAPQHSVVPDGTVSWVPAGGPQIQTSPDHVLAFEGDW